jgi:hypothetical protein
MLRISTIIVIMKIMVEVLKISMLLWCLRAAARMARMRDVVPSTCHHTEIQVIITVIRMRMPKPSVVKVVRGNRTTGTLPGLGRL